MPGYHINRTAEDLKRELIALLRELKDPRVQGKLLTVVRVELSADAAAAKVFLSAMEGREAAEEAVKGLKSAAGFLRGELGRRLRLRKAPELRFVADASIEDGTRITRLIELLVPKTDEQDGSE
ncbi:MAG: 30S ribosome-binding factor RbfA [Oscillospiraceae bacterium]|jgi:ribosome-binding factor A|nr:30S ribosome-binding factor RbfA [Oscillospiraceae bacterium]